MTIFSGPARSPARLLLLLCVLLGLVGIGAPSPTAVAATSDPVGVWPLQPQPDVVRGFEPPSSEYGSGHRGVDLAGTLGQVVGSALPGRVSFAGRLAGRGVVVVDHGDTRTTYEPVSATVHVGDIVAAGDPIGRLELVGSHCFPAACLHWGWLRGDVYLDPLRLVGRAPVRLLPLWPTPLGPTSAERPDVRPDVRPPYADWRPLSRRVSILAALLGPFGWLAGR